jgi:hypothetical protein
MKLKFPSVSACAKSKARTNLAIIKCDSVAAEGKVASEEGEAEPEKGLVNKFKELKCQGIGSTVSQLCTQCTQNVTVGHRHSTFNPRCNLGLLTGRTNRTADLRRRGPTCAGQSVGRGAPQCRSYVDAGARVGARGE